MKRLYLDPGHGGSDPGGVNGTRQEKNDVLDLSNAIIERLKDYDVDIKTSRTTDMSKTLAVRTAEANAFGADLVVSLHRNAFGNATAKGVEVWTYTTPTTQDTKIAKDILNKLVAVGVSANRGVKAGNYAILRDTKAPSCMVELGFITNSQDNADFDNKFSDYVRAISGAIIAFLELSIVEVPSDDTACQEENAKLKNDLLQMEYKMNTFIQDIEDIIKKYKEA